MIRLVPQRYVCRIHDHDLTEMVRAKVETEPWVTANLAWRPTRKGLVKVGTFEVDVRCPDGGSEGHVLRFDGSFEK
jgi:hypothetical protein